jgi:hypothetical protein
VTLAPKGLLIEEQRTNLATYSEDFTNSAWNKLNVFLTANATTAPDGTTTADKIAISAATAVTGVYNSPGVTVSLGTVTVTAYAKADGVQYANVGLIYSGGVFSGTQFDLISGTVVRSAAASYTSPSGTITPVGNGWYRCSHTVTVTTTLIYPLAVPSNALWTTGEPRQTLTGDGTSGAFIWGAQLEAGAFATSYIPTVASQVTRAADSASMIGNNFARWYNQTEGTLYSDVSQFALPSATVNSMLISNGVSNSFSIGLITFGTAAGFQVVDSTTQANLGPGTVTANVGYKLSGVYKINDFASSLNGAAAVTDTSGTVPTGMTTLGIGVRLGGTFLNGTIKRLAYYNRRLANTELTAITS